LIKRLPQPKKRPPKRLGEGEKAPAKMKRLKRGKPKEQAPLEESLPQVKNCPACGRTNAPDANFCQYCAEKLIPLSE
jgi:uncharacterized OB-fold protein